MGAVSLRAGEASLVVEPDYGGLVNSLIVPTPQGPREIIEGVSKQDLASNSGFRGSVLFPFPNRLRDGCYQFAGNSYRFAVNEPSTQTALHGFLYRIPAEVEKKDKSLLVAYRLPGDEPGYPFKVDVLLDYQLSAKGSLRVELTICNRDRAEVPVGFGWHPYFSLGQALDQCSLQMPAAQCTEIDERMLPTGRKVPDRRFVTATRLAGVHLDSCFEFPATEDGVSAQFTSEAAGFGLEFWQQGMNFMQIYTPPERQSLAIEPMSCGIDALNTGEGLIRLAPQQIFRSAYGVRVIGS